MPKISIGYIKSLRRQILHGNAVHLMQICLLKSAFSARTEHLSTGIFFLNPLWPCLLCAKIRRQSFRMSGTTTGVYKSPLLTSFCFRMLFSIVYMLWSKFLFSHCFLSCFMCGSLSCNLTSLLSFRGRWMSVFISIGSVC